jgi:hypothetical protein
MDTPGRKIAPWLEKSISSLGISLIDAAPSISSHAYKTHRTKKKILISIHFLQIWPVQTYQYHSTVFSGL